MLGLECVKRHGTCTSTRAMEITVKGILAVLLCVLAGVVRAQTDPEAWLRQWNRAVLREWVLDTRICMRESIDVMVMNGIRDVDKIYSFVLLPCGDHIRRVFDSQGAHSEAFVRALAMREILRYPGLYKPKPEELSSMQATPLERRAPTAQKPDNSQRALPSDGDVGALGSGGYAIS